MNVELVGQMIRPKDEPRAMMSSRLGLTRSPLAEFLEPTIHLSSSAICVLRTRESPILAADPSVIACMNEGLI